MRPLSSLNVESELSYAYLHAVASRAGMSCRDGNRHEDGNGIDAALTAWLPPAAGRLLTEVDLKVQLKATIADPEDDGGHLHYRLAKASRYNDLRCESVSAPRILVVLFLPRDDQDWIRHTSDQLVLKRCAFWVSLRGAPDITGDSVKVKLPSAQRFAPDTLAGLVDRLSRLNIPRYGEL